MSTAGATFEAPDVAHIAQLERARDDIAALMLARGLQPAERTLGAEVRAQTFIDQVIGAAHTGDWPGVAAWIECEYACAGAPALQTLRYGTEVVAHKLRASGLHLERLREGIELVDAAVARLTFRQAGGGESPDEIASAVEMMLAGLSEYDPELATRARDVGAWCARIAGRLSMSEPEATFVARCGLLCDVGTVIVPKTLLHAPRPLHVEERALVRDHAAVGGRMVAQAGVLAEFAPAVRAHHERFDGRGYPEGLGGFEIPAAARIVTVADTFNAMIARRPYRDAISPSRAIEELKRNRGTQFDPIVVDAAIDLLHGRSH